MSILDMTDEEIEGFMAECDMGLHPLNPEDEAALERAWPELQRRIEEILSGQP